MKLIKTALLAMCATLVVFTCVACGSSVNITLGTYNETNQTFTTGVTGYKIAVSGNTITLSGDIPYSQGILGLPAGNIVAIKFKPTQTFTPDEQTSIKTSNSTSQEGWNTYGQENIESDGSVIWVTAVNTTDNAQIKIKWNAETEEVTYTLVVAENANLLTE